MKRETFKDIIIPLMTVISSTVIGVSSAYIAVNANKIYQTQALIAKNAEAPTIDVKENTYDSKHEIEVYFLDGKYENYQAEIITFLKCEFCDYEDMIWTVLNELEFPVVHYYATSEYSNEKHGLVETMISDHYYTFYNTLQNNLEKYYNNREPQTLVTAIQSYLKITYQNFLDEEEDVYYMFDAGKTPSVIRIDEDLGEEKFKEHQKSIQDEKNIIHVENGEASLEEVYQRLKE